MSGLPTETVYHGGAAEYSRPSGTDFPLGLSVLLELAIPMVPAIAGFFVFMAIMAALRRRRERKQGNSSGAVEEGNVELAADDVPPPLPRKELDGEPVYEMEDTSVPVEIGDGAGGDATAAPT